MALRDTLGKSWKRVSIKLVDPANMSGKTEQTNVSFKQKREQDALELAQLVYDMFIEKQTNDSIKTERKDNYA